MAEFGAAVHDAQVLEQSLELILALLDQFKAVGEVLPNPRSLYSSAPNTALGPLINALRKRVTLPADISDTLEVALKTRNSLVHGHFKSEARLRASFTQSGVRSLIDELREIRAQIKSANCLTDEILNSLLAKFGTSVEEAKRSAERLYDEANLREFRGSIH